MSKPHHSVRGTRLRASHNTAREQWISCLCDGTMTALCCEQLLRWMTKRTSAGLAVYALSFFSLMTFGRKTASWPDIRRPSARSSFAPRASLLMSSVFSLLSMYRWEARRLSSRRSKPAFHDLISWALGSPDVDEAAERCEGAMEGVRVGVAL